MPLFSSLNIRSKIIAAMLAAAALTGLTQAWLGNDNVQDGYSSSLQTRLSAIAEITAGRVEGYFANARAIATSLGEDLMVAEALGEFTNSIGISVMSSPPKMVERMKEYYADNYVSRLVTNDGSTPLVDALVPDSVPARFLQFHYVVANKAAIGKKSELDMANDGSPYSAAHARFHPPLRAIRENFGFEDVFLINPRGVVVYSTIKEIDFMTDLTDGPFSDSGLAKAFSAAKLERANRPVVMVDYSFYQPSYGAPSFFIATPVFIGRQFKGVIAVQLSAVQINAVVNNKRGWKAAGLGKNGDIFIVGSDGLLRTTVRKFERERDAFLVSLRDNGTPETIVKKIQAFDTPVNLGSAVNRLPATGEDRSRVSHVVKNFEGKDAQSVLVAMKIPGLDWNMVAEMPLEEANVPVSSFQRLMMVALALTVAITTIGAMLVSGWITRPLRALAGRLDNAAQGDLDTKIALPQSSEIGHVSKSAQTLVDSLHSRLSAAEKVRADTQGLLSRFLPDGIVRVVGVRQQEGDSDLDHIAEEIPNATFVLATLSGYEAMMSSLPPAESVDTLDQLVHVIDLAADKHGVEKVRTAGASYFAVAGLSTPHIDHRQRGLAFARDLQEIIERFRRDNDVDLQIRIGIASGAAVSGVIGRHKLAFDIWGQPVGESEMLNAAAAPGEIRVTQEFADNLKDVETFVPPPNREKPGLLLSQSGATVSASKKPGPARKRKAGRKAGSESKSTS